MHAKMDLELLKFINSDLTWHTVKKGHRSMMRRPRKPVVSSCDFGFGLCNKNQNSALFDYEKSGVAVLGQHFAEEVLDVPIKKRILMLHSPSLNGERALSPQPKTPSSHHEEPRQLVGRKHDSGQQCHSDSPSNIRELKVKNGSSNSELLKPTTNLNDFSGIELLAAAACDSSDKVESSAVKEHTIAGVDSYTDGIKENIAPMDSDDSSIPDNTSPVTQNLCDNENDRDDRRVVPSKDVRLHWDLNTVMDEWEEPCYDILVDPRSQKSLQNAKANLEGYEARNSEVAGGEFESMSHGVCGNKPGTNDAAISATPLIKQEIGVSFGKMYDAVDDIASSREAVGAITFKTSDAESCISKSGIVDSFVHPVKCENLSTSTASVSQEQTIVKVESDTIHFEPSKKFDDRQAVSEVVQGGCRSLKGDGDDKLISEDRLSDCCGSNVSQEGNMLDKAKAGYDSPFEDGELRDSTGYMWQKNEVEERDCVDYECDNMYEDNFETIESEKNDVSPFHGGGGFVLENRALGAVPNNEIEQCAKADSSKRPNCLLGSKDGSLGEFLPKRKDGHDELRTLGGNLCIDRSTSLDLRKNGAYIHWSRSDNIKDSYSRAKRDSGPENFTGRDGPSSIGAWDSRNSRGYSRPKNVIGGSAARSNSSSLDNNQAISYNPRDIHRTFNTRPSPSDRNEPYGTKPARALSRDRFRGGSGFNLQGWRRTPQEEYHDPELCYSERKVRYFSPNFNRGAHLSGSRRRSRSRSRSRSGSPIAWHFQKRRNVDTKTQSPDSRSYTRVQGERFPLRKPSFSGEIEAGFVSPHDRNTINGQFRDRRPSPVKPFHRNPKFDSNGYLVRLKSNDHFRPRFPQKTGFGREYKFVDNSNDKRIHDDKYKFGMMDGGRRFRYTVDDSFKTRNKDDGFKYTRNENRCFKDPVGRDVPENTSEKKGCRYTINKMFSTSGDFHKDVLQRER